MGISTLVLLANENEQAQDYLHRTLDAERKRLSESVAENEKLRTELTQVKLELKLERQNKFATNQQKQADPTPQPEPEPEKPKSKRGAPVGHPGWFRPTPTHYDWAVDVPAPRRCPHCCGPIDILTGIEPSHHLQEDIIDGVYRVVLYRHAACRCGQSDLLVERALRPLVVLRKITFGHRSANGAHTMAKLMTVAETARRHGHRASDIYFELYTRPPDAVMRRLYAQSPATAS